MDRPSYEYKAILVRWIDGDTADLKIDLGFDVWINARVRLVGPEGGYFNAPEIKGPERPDGLLALDRVREVVPEGSEFVVRTFKGASRGKYGRWLAYIPGAVEAVEGM